MGLEFIKFLDHHPVPLIKNKNVVAHGCILSPPSTFVLIMFWIMEVKHILATYVAQSKGSIKYNIKLWYWYFNNDRSCKMHCEHLLCYADPSINPKVLVIEH